MNAQERIQRYESLRKTMENERSTFISHWRELAEYILPRRPRFNTFDVNKGDKRNQKIIDSTATYTMRTLRSGMMSGITSPARPWFRLTTQDPGMAESGPVKDWLYVMTTRMQTVFARSNLYNMLPVVYGDLGTFGTAAMLVEEDFDKVIHCHVFPIGSYSISCNDKGYVDCFSRTFMLTVRQIIEKFATDKEGEIDFSPVSDTVKNAYLNGQHEMWIEIVHFICPNADYNPKAANAKFKKYTSCYYETGGSSTGGTSPSNIHTPAGGRPDKFLRDSGYDRFRVLVPRWEVTGEDVWGTDCPGMTILGDTKALQTAEKRTAMAIDKMINPPLVGPGQLRNSTVSLLPGEITYQDTRDGQTGLRPVHELNFRIAEVEQMKEQIRMRIRKGGFEDLFLMLATSDRREITAREVEERHEEKLWALGPVLERLNQDLLDPLIDITFDTMLAQGLVPDPPEELQGTNLKVEYVSVMAQAQKLIGLSSIERFTQFAAQVAAVNPDALDKFDTDQVLDVYGDLTGIPPGIIRPDDEVEQRRQERQQAIQQQQQMMNVAEGAKAAKDLSAAKTDDENVLSNLLKGRV
jgi:hypothetical protein